MKPPQIISITQPRVTNQDTDKVYSYKKCNELRDEIVATRKQRDTLAEAAQAVVDRWDAPTWKDLEPTAKFMKALRNALAAVKGGSDE